MNTRVPLALAASVLLLAVSGCVSETGPGYAEAKAADPVLLDAIPVEVTDHLAATERRHGLSRREARPWRPAVTDDGTQFLARRLPPCETGNYEPTRVAADQAAADVAWNLTEQGPRDYLVARQVAVWPTVEDAEAFLAEFESDVVFCPYYRDGQVVDLSQSALVPHMAAAELTVDEALVSYGDLTSTGGATPVWLTVAARTGNTVVVVRTVDPKPKNPEEYAVNDLRLVEFTLDQAGALVQRLPAPTETGE